MTTTQSIAQKAADNIRLLSVAMVERANSGHPGGPMGGADFMHILYTEFLNFDPDNMAWPERDRFYLDPGHMSAMLYSTLALTGNYSLEDLKNFRQWGSVTPGHPELDINRGVENTSGPLGLGHAFGVGSAISERFMAARFGKGVEHKTYLYISDGGIQEEISQGAGRIAGHLGLGNVIMFYDANDVQLSSTVDEVTTEDTAAKYRAWGWHVTTIDGHKHEEIRTALKTCIATDDKPSLIIGRTVMGKGAVNEAGAAFEGKVELHGQPIGNSNASYEKTVLNLGGTVQEPFVFFDDVQAYYQKVLAEKRAAAKQKKHALAEWTKSNAKLAKQYAFFLSGELPELNWEDIATKPNSATRVASSAVLSYLADNVGNMIVSSADLSNSDKTDGFLKKTSVFRKGDFSGAFLQAGVAELTMAAVSVGMALHGGVVPVCATFFAFSDYMKPAIRVAALMETRLIFLWTHDAFRVGEDGPTHQPVEQEAQLRLLEKLQNHSGRNSVLALRPADRAETIYAWKAALENTQTPSGLILSRQGIPDIPMDTRAKQAMQLEKGGYIVQEFGETPKAVLIGNGSEVSTLYAGAQLLFEKHGIASRVVSIPSEGLFRKQDLAYQQAIIPNDIPRFGLTAGLPVNLIGLVGDQGRIWGLDHFGYSAPNKVLDEKFGFTPENVMQEVLALLKSQ